VPLVLPPGFKPHSCRRVKRYAFGNADAIGEEKRSRMRRPLETIRLMRKNSMLLPTLFGGQEAQIERRQFAL